MGSKVGIATEYHGTTATQIKASKGILHRVTINDIGSSWIFALFDDASSTTTYEYFTGTANSSTAIYDTNESAQTFTVGTLTTNARHFVSRIGIKAYRTGTPGTITVGIYAVDGSHKPTGSALATSTVSANAWTTDTAGLWYDFDMTTPYELAVSTEYAIVVSGGVDSSNKITWLLKSTSGYVGGQHETSADSGSTWTVGSGDYNFYEYGFTSILTATPTQTETLEVRSFLSRGIGVVTISGTPGSATVVSE